MAKKTRGDVLRINITPASTRFPWIKIYKHPYGIRKPGHEVKNYPGNRLGIGAQKDKSRKKSPQGVALEIGMAIVRNSEVLKNWF